MSQPRPLGGGAARFGGGRPAPPPETALAAASTSGGRPAPRSSAHNPQYSSSACEALLWTRPQQLGEVKAGFLVSQSVLAGLLLAVRAGGARRDAGNLAVWPVMRAVLWWRRAGANR
jgi:hypothetical protein